MILCSRLLLILGMLIALVCTLSLPLILLDRIAPDPHPWNWPTIYLIDFLYGFSVWWWLPGFLRRSAANRLWTAAVGGYTTLAFGQSTLECLLDILGLQTAPVTAQWPIFLFMFVGLLFGVLMLSFAFRYGQYWTNPSLREPDI